MRDEAQPPASVSPASPSFLSDSDSATAPCWSCGEGVDALAPFCHACGVVLPPRPLDPFRRLGFRPDFAIDPDAIEDRYLAFQRILHPDRFAGKSARERGFAESRIADLNEAYAILKDPVRRAAALLEKRGRSSLAAKEGTLADPAILSEALEWRENLLAAATIADKEKLLAAAGARAIDRLARLGAAFAAEDFQAAEGLVLHLRYLRKFLEDGRAHLASLADEA